MNLFATCHGHVSILIPMHILHLYKDYFPVPGGIENHVRALAEGLAARGHRVTVLVTSTTPRDEISQRGNLTVIKAGRLLHLASTPLSLKMLWYARHLTGVDVIDLHFPYPPGDLAALLVPRGPPLVVTYHSDIVRQRLLLRAYGPLLNLTLNRAARIVPTSANYIASSPWLHPRSHRCTVSPLSVDVVRFASPDKSAVSALRSRYGGDGAVPLLLFVGKLRYYKGLHFLFEALRLMHAQARLLLVGSGPEEARLRDLARSLHIDGRVYFLGAVSDEELPSLYGAADVFVLPSHLRAEAFGIVQIEAQAAGLPVVCTELDTGTSAITRHGVTGFVVPPAHPPDLARALDVLVANPDLSRRMGEAGRVRATGGFSHDRMIERMEQIYREAQPGEGPMV